MAYLGPKWLLRMCIGVGWLDALRATMELAKRCVILSGIQGDEFSLEAELRVGLVSYVDVYLTFYNVLALIYKT